MSYKRLLKPIQNDGNAIIKLLCFNMKSSITRLAISICPREFLLSSTHSFLSYFPFLHTHPCSQAASFLGQSSAGKVVSSSSLSRRLRFASNHSETSWFVWQTQMPLNSQSPGFLPASYLVMHYSHPLLHTPNPLTLVEGQPHTTSLAENPYGLDVFASSGQLVEPQPGSIFSHNCS